jgi:hypothetical protein
MAKAMFGIALDNFPLKTTLKFLEDLGYTEEFKERTVPGCHHMHDRTLNKFCPQCGEVSFKVEDAWNYNDLIGEVQDEIEAKIKLNCEHLSDVGWVIGVHIHQVIEYEKVLEHINKSIPILHRYFPNKKPSFHVE